MIDVALVHMCVYEILGTCSQGKGDHFEIGVFGEIHSEVCSSFGRLDKQDSGMGHGELVLMRDELSQDLHLVVNIVDALAELNRLIKYNGLGC